MFNAIRRVAADIDVRSVLPTINVPTLVPHSADDKVVDVRHGRHLASNIPGARYIEIPGIEHYPWFSNDPGVLDEIQEFITGVRPVPEIDRVLCTVLFTDIVRSTELASSLGMRGGATCSSSTTRSCAKCSTGFAAAR